MRLQLLILSILISFFILLSCVLRVKKKGKGNLTGLHFPSLNNRSFTPEAIDAACNRCVSSDSVYARLYLLIQKGIITLDTNEDGYILKEAGEQYRKQSIKDRNLIEGLFDQSNSIDHINKKAKERIGIYLRSSAFYYSKHWYNELSVGLRLITAFAMILPLFTYFALLFSAHQMTILHLIFSLSTFVVLACFFAASPNLPISAILDNKQEPSTRWIALIKHAVPLLLYIAAMLIFKNVLAFIILIGCYALDSLIAQHFYTYTEEGKKWRDIAYTFKADFSKCHFADDDTRLIVAYLSGNMDQYESHHPEKAEAFCDFLSWCEKSK